MICLFTACSKSTINKTKSCCEGERLNFMDVADFYFSDKYYNYEVPLKRGGVEMVNLYLDNSITDAKFHLIDKEIRKKWKLVYSNSSENYYIYCFNKYNDMVVLKPNSLDVKDKFGDKLYLTPDSINKWGVAFEYNNEGTEYCKNEIFNAF